MNQERHCYESALTHRGQDCAAFARESGHNGRRCFALDKLNIFAYCLMLMGGRIYSVQMNSRILDDSLDSPLHYQFYIFLKFQFAIQSTPTSSGCLPIFHYRPLYFPEQRGEVIPSFGTNPSTPRCTGVGRIHPGYGLVELAHLSLSG